MRLMLFWRVPMTLALLSIPSLTAVEAAPMYHLTVLGTLGGAVSFATGINSSGAVVGGAYLANNQGFHAFLYTSASGMQDLGTLGGFSSYANAINDFGQVVGSSFTSSFGDQHAFLFNQGMQDLGTLGGSSDNSYAYAINSLGQVVGYGMTTGNATTHGFLFDAGGLHDLGTLQGSYSDAYGINSSGRLAHPGAHFTHIPTAADKCTISKPWAAWTAPPTGSTNPVRWLERRI